MTPPPDLDSAKTAAEYWVVLRRIVPLIFVGGLVSLIINFMRIAHEPTWLGRICAGITTIAIGCIAAGTAALGIELFLHESTIELELMIAAIAGAGGQKIFDVYARRIFGFQNTRATDRLSENGAKSD